MTLPIVHVKFKDSKYNYSTNVAEDVTEQKARAYFVGARFNVGAFPEEIMRECIDIDYEI